MSRLVTFLSPVAVVVTGDLVDGKAEDMVGSGQYRQEWQSYAGAVQAARQASNTTAWLDIRLFNSNSFI